MGSRTEKSENDPRPKYTKVDPTRCSLEVTFLEVNTKTFVLGESSDREGEVFSGYPSCHSYIVLFPRQVVPVLPWRV